MKKYLKIQKHFHLQASTRAIESMKKAIYLYQEKPYNKVIQIQ